MDIDLVYLWVDGNDPVWQAKKLACTGGFDEGTENNSKARYESNDELKYSLRSVEKYASWIRKIFIVTDSQTPAWLDTANPGIQIIDHTEILPPEALPCYNSVVLEYFLYRIPGLSEHFLYANDDTFFNASLSPGFFFSSDGYPYVRLKKEYFERWFYRLKKLLGIKIGYYRKLIFDSTLLVEKKWGKFYHGTPHHNIDAYTKSDYQNAVEVVFKEQIECSLSHHVRTEGDLLRSAFSFYMLAIGHGHLKYVKRRESGRIRVHKPDFMKYIDRYRPQLFCLNDSQHATDEDRKRIKPFLEALFPVKSAFEK